jgi:hypothetical protein
MELTRLAFALALTRGAVRCSLVHRSTRRWAFHATPWHRGVQATGRHQLSITGGHNLLRLHLRTCACAGVRWWWWGNTTHMSGTGAGSQCPAATRRGAYCIRVQTCTQGASNRDAARRKADAATRTWGRPQICCLVCQRPRRACIHLLPSTVGWPTHSWPHTHTHLGYHVCFGAARHSCCGRNRCRCLPLRVCLNALRLPRSFIITIIHGQGRSQQAGVNRRTHALFGRALICATCTTHLPRRRRNATR